MSGRVEKLLETLPSIDSIEDLGSIINVIRDVFQVGHVTYLALSLGHGFRLSSRPASGSLIGDGGTWWRHATMLGAGTYAPEWGVRYAEAGYARIDPVVEGASRSFLPVNWKELDWDSKLRRQFFREAIECGIGNQGYTIPLRGPDGQFAIFVINDNTTDQKWKRYIEENRQDILIVAHFFHQKVIEVERIFGDPPKVKLSTRELDVLRYLAGGKSRGQVADQLKISENTIRVYIDSARHKLGALNVTHAIAITLSKGIITL